MAYSTDAFALCYDPLDQQLNFEGIFRPASESEAQSALDYMVEVHDSLKGALNLNFQKLRYINAVGIKTISSFVKYARHQNSLNIRVIASGVLAWSERVLPNLQKIWEEIEFSIHDQDFYKSQDIIEDQSFIPLLRNQTRILWPQEISVLKKHGLEKGMRVADICCGCGDVSLLISRELKPDFVQGVDHSAAAVNYARNLQYEFRIQNSDFLRGDATALMMNDNSFDFVLCRLSLQIFSQPEQILKELIRITKPGGRIYALCEDYDLNIGYPESEDIRETYTLAADYGDQMGMDLRSGKKLHHFFTRSGLENIQTDHIFVDTNNSDRDAFANVIQSWQKFSVDAIGNQLNITTEQQATLNRGYDAQKRTIANTAGFTTWGLVACSGQKPEKN